MTNNLPATASTPPKTPAEEASPVRQRATAAEARLTPVEWGLLSRKTVFDRAPPNTYHNANQSRLAQEIPSLGIAERGYETYLLQRGKRKLQSAKEHYE